MDRARIHQVGKINGLLKKSGGQSSFCPLEIAEKYGGIDVRQIQKSDPLDKKNGGIAKEN